MKGKVSAPEPQAAVDATCPDPRAAVAATVSPHLCSSWSERPSQATSWLLGNYQIVRLGGQASAGTVKVTGERIWVDIQPTQQLSARAGSARGLLAIKPWFHPSERKLCLNAVTGTAVLQVSPLAADGTLTLALAAESSWQATTPHASIVLRKLGSEIAVAAPRTVGDAIRSGTLADLERLLAQTPPPHEPADPTPLQLAVQEQQLAMVELLLSQGAGIEATSTAPAGSFGLVHGSTPLRLAVENQQLQMVERLLNAGAKVGSNGNELLARAIATPGPMPTEIVELLLRAGTAWQTDTVVEHQLPRSEELLRLLLCHGLDANRVVGGEEPLLHATIREGSLAAVRRLLAAKADITRLDASGRTAIDVAVAEEKVEIAGLLFAAGATLRPDGHAELLQNSLWNPALLAELLKHGVSANTDVDGRSLLHLLTEGGFAEAVELVLKAGGDPRAKDDQGRVPLELADDPDTQALLRKATGDSAPGSPQATTAPLVPDEMVPIVGDGKQMKNFRLDRTEVTVASYRACVQAGKCTAPAVAPMFGRSEPSSYHLSDRETHPVADVTIVQAEAYCSFRGKRLPTAAEHAWAATGGARTRKYPWGNGAPSCQRAVIDQARGLCGATGTLPVGSTPRGASPERALDLVGNVAEWLKDGSKTADTAGYDFTSPADEIASGTSNRLAGPAVSARWLGFRCASRTRR